MRELEADIKAFLAGVDKPSFTLHWRIETHDNLGKLVLVYDDVADGPHPSLSTGHKKEVEHSRWHKKIMRATSVKDITEEVYSMIRKYLDDLLSSAE